MLPHTLYMVPLTGITPTIKIIEISDSFNYTRSSKDIGSEFGCSHNCEDLKELVEEEGWATSIRIEIREAGHGFSFPKMVVVNS